MASSWCGVCVSSGSSASICLFVSNSLLSPDLSGILSPHPVPLSLLRGHRWIPVLDVIVTPAVPVPEHLLRFRKSEVGVKIKHGLRYLLEGSWEQSGGM